MFFFKKIILLCFKDRLEKIFSNDINKISLIIENFYESFKKFNYFLKFLILIFFTFVIIVNLIFIIIFFFKLKINFFSEATNFSRKIPYFKNINNFIYSNLLLHLD